MHTGHGATGAAHTERTTCTPCDMYSSLLHTPLQLAAVAWANSASVSGLIDNANVCTRDYARTDARLACIHGPEEPTNNNNKSTLVEGGPRKINK